MPSGDFGGVGPSPIVEAIAAAETGTSGEIRVHISKRPFEKNAFHRAGRLFERFGMSRTTHRNGILLYVNLRRRKLAIVGDSGINAAVGPRYWEKLCRELRENLLSTHPERAIAIAVLALGRELRRHFPSEPAEARASAGLSPASSPNRKGKPKK